MKLSDTGERRLATTVARSARGRVIRRYDPMAQAAARAVAVNAAQLRLLLEPRSRRATMPLNPINPEPKRDNVAGSGTAGC